MKDRNCENCVHAHPFGGDNDNRCDAWECEFIDRQEAIEAYKARREKENDMGVKNIEKIKNSTDEEMVNLICTIIENDNHAFFTDYYGKKICKYRPCSGCPFGEDDAPCIGVAWKDGIRGWLQAEVE